MYTLFISRTPVKVPMSQIFSTKNNNFKKLGKSFYNDRMHYHNLHDFAYKYYKDRVLCKQRCKGLQKIQSILKQIEVD